MNKLKTWKSFLILSGLSVLIWNSIVLYYTFLVAFFNPSKTTTISINSFSEAWFEFFLIPFSLLLGVIALVLLFKHANLKIRIRRKHETIC